MCVERRVGFFYSCCFDSSQLRKVVDQVDSHPEQLQPPVGVMTSEHRDTWAKASERKKEGIYLSHSRRP